MAKNTRKKAKVAQGSPLELLTAATELQDIRLVETLCQQKIKEGPLPTKTALGVEITTKHVDEAGAFKIHVGFELTIRYEEEVEDEKPAIRVHARFQLSFLAADQSLATPEAVEAFGDVYAVLMIWPYWREHVNNLNSRMGLPAFTVPLLKPGMLKLTRVERTPAKNVKK